MRTWTGSYVLMRSWLPVVLVLWLGTAAVAAAAPRVGPGAAGRTQLSRPKHATVSTGTIVPTVADVITAEDCPGIQANGTSCGTVRCHGHAATALQALLPLWAPSTAECSA